ncbi:MAG: glycosyltransferase family 2 protein [Ginsengibacter sp.]
MTKEKTAKVTVLMPAYNAGKYIAEAIQSVLQQSFKDFQLLIINDGSTDNTEAIIRSFKDQRIRLINQSHKGIATTLNKGLSKAGTEYVARFDADDVCFPERLMQQVLFLDNHVDYIVVGSEAEYISENGEHLFNFKSIGHTHERIIQKIYSCCPFIHSSVMYRKEAVIKAGGYSVHAHNFEDYLLWIQLLKSGRFYNLPQQLIRVRFNPASVTIDERWRGRIFRKLKHEIISKGSITEKEGSHLYNIIKSQDFRNIKEGSYYALCGKKILLDNHQAKKARPLFSKAIMRYPYRLDNYGLYLLSFFPDFFITWLNRKKADKILQS